MDMEQIVECVPNFSEGRDPEVIRSIVEAIAPEGEDRVRVLHVDSGAGANRTVVTFAGEPAAVCEAAFRAVETAARLIDMRTQKGTHPRSGATDVLPLVPVKGISLEACARMARDLAGRIWRELGIPCYCYGAAAASPQRAELSWCRRGEYEALTEKLADPLRRPDFGPAAWNATVARSGAVNVGARPFLVAVNFNLVPDAPLAVAKAIAARMRGPGRKAIGWYIEEYGRCQVSMNLTDIDIAPLHAVYADVCREAAAAHTRITGTEIIGLVPERVLLEAVPASSGTSSAGRVAAAVRQLHLDDLRPFHPAEKILEYVLGQ